MLVMYKNNYTTKWGLLLVTALIISTGIFAQRGYDRHRYYRPVYYHGPRVYSFHHPYVSIGFGGIHYRYYGGYFYRPFGSYFRIVAPPVGIRIAILPPGYRRIYVGDYPYYYYNGTFYEPGGSNEYRVVNPPLGARVPQLPKDAHVMVIDGKKYYELDGTYYKEEITPDNEIWYTVVGTNGTLETDQPAANGNNDADKDVQRNSSNRNDNSPVGNDYKVGDRVDKLPEGCREVVISGKKYYESPDGIYYQEVIGRNQVSYEVAGKASGN